jgi:hypothetical protein
MGHIESFGGSTNEVNEKALAAVADFIQTVQPGGMVQKFVLLVETIDNDDRWLSAFTAPGQKRWDSMGMMQYGMTIEQNTVLEADPDIDE